MDALLQDIRYALRSLGKAKGFTALAVLCLAIGIGLNTTIFSVVDAILFKPFGFKDIERLVILQDRRIKDTDSEYGLSYANFEDLRQRVSSFADLGIQGARSMTLTDGEEPERILAATVSANLFTLLGVEPALGRQFREDEDRPGAPPVIMLSDELWKRRYNGDPSVVGREIPVNGKPTTVVGVMPPRFKFPESELLWVPVRPLVHTTPRDERGLATFARLKPGVTIKRANSELTAIAAALASEYPRENEGFTTRAVLMRDELVPADMKLVILAMMGAVTSVLLIACANVANLLLARASSRHREIAIRSAIGAGRGRIVRQLLTESVLIALAGAALGMLIALWGLDLMNAAIPPSDQVPYYIQWKIDGRALVYAIVVAVFTGLLFGLAPALQTTGTNLQESLKEGARGATGSGRRSRLRNGLVVAEVALSLVLLVTAALFVRSFMALQYVDPGFDVKRLMTMRLYLPGDPYETDDSKRLRLEDVIRRVEALPGVEAATASNTIAIGGGGAGDGIIAEGRDVPAGEEPNMFYTGVTAHWLRTHGVPILKGRDLTEAEASDSAAVAVVNQSFAKKLWGAEEPIGRRFRLRGDRTNTWVSVVGLVRDFKLNDIDDKTPNDEAAFLPYLWSPARNNGITIRVSGDPAQISAGARKAIHASDRGLPVFEVQSMDELRVNSFWQYGLFGSMFTIFGVVALVLALVGVYGVISYGVSQRTHEIGVRMALGARSEDVLRMIVIQGARLAGIGIAVGLLAAFGAGRAISSILFATSPADPLSFAVIALLLTGTAVLASWVPARRAAAVDPMVALRDQ